jgi:hypothetical protein
LTVLECFDLGLEYVEIGYDAALFGERRHWQAFSRIL